MWMGCSTCLAVGQSVVSDFNSQMAEDQDPSQRSLRAPAGVVVVGHQPFGVCVPGVRVYKIQNANWRDFPDWNLFQHQLTPSFVDLEFI